MAQTTQTTMQAEKEKRRAEIRRAVLARRQAAAQKEAQRGQWLGLPIRFGVKP